MSSRSRSALDTAPSGGPPRVVGRRPIQLKPWGNIVLVVVVAVVFAWPAWGFIALTGGLAAEGYNDASPCPPSAAAFATDCIHVTPYLLVGTRTVAISRGGHNYYLDLIPPSGNQVDMRLNTRGDGWALATVLPFATEVSGEIYRGALMGVRLPGGQLLVSHNIPSARIDQGIAILSFFSVFAVGGLIINRVDRRHKKIRRPPARPGVLVTVDVELLILAGLVILGAGGHLAHWAYTSGIIALAAVLTAQMIVVLYHPARTPDFAGPQEQMAMPEVARLAPVDQSDQVDQVTAVVVCEDGVWNVSWTDGDLPDEEGLASLEASITWAEAAVRARYASSPERETAELWHAIYPWDFVDDESVIVLDISGTPGNLVARDNPNPKYEIGAPNLDQLVAAVAAQLPLPTSAMFCWGKKVAEL